MLNAKHIIGLPVFQGDVCLLPVAELPATAELVKAENGSYIVTHSETGHHHIVMERPTVQMYQDKLDIMRGWLEITGEPAVLEHLRSTDTHEAISFEPGIYEIRRQREYSPAGWQRAAD
jgi:hypothetical protein